MLKKSISLWCMISMIGIGSMWAQDIPKPELKPTKSSALYIRCISDNGKWGVVTVDGAQDGDILPGGSILVDLTTMKETKLNEENYSGANDVSDDGNIVVGLVNGVPAYYTVSEGKWTKLKLPLSYNTGYLNSVTPDGHYAVGSASPASNPYNQIPVAYDLTTNTRIELTGLPKLDMTHENQNQMTFDRISADGRYALGVMSFSYIQPASLCTFVYDLQNHTYKMVGFEENDTKPWTPKAPGLHFIDAANMSPNGRWVTGQAYMVKEVAGSEFANEYIVGFLYDVENDKFEVFDGQYDTDVSGVSVTDDGVVLGTTPAINPYSETMIRRGGYWYSLRNIFEKVYDVDLEAKAHVSVTGKPISISADGLTTAQLCSTRDCFILKMGESFFEASKRIKILGMPEITPVDGSDFAQLSQIKLRFDRKIEIAKAANTVLLKKEGTQMAAGINTYLDGNEVTIVFRSRTLEKGVDYTVEIPEGYVTLTGDASQGNDAITLHYRGRGTGPVEIIKAQPADGSTFSYIDATANPLMYTFDTNIKIADGATFKLYEDDGAEPIADLQLLAAGDMVIAYPILTQNLFKDSEYKVVIPAGSVTDLTGIGPNEEYTYHYTGSYVREVQSTGKYIFTDDCDNRYNYMSYDGDNNTPCEDMTYWTFTSQTPWVEVRENMETTDMALASHSMYTPAGKSDDWLVTPQLYIPDEICYLQFQSQGYKKGYEDHLKVYVYPSEKVYNKLNASLVEDIRTTGVLVYDKIQDPGADEENLSGDWTDNMVSLADFAGKNIYIAFLNDNENQSAVFIDNVRVIHDVTYTIAFTNKESVVNEEKIKVKGVIKIESEVETYTDLSLSLLNEEGTEVSKIEKSGLELKSGDTYEFEFPQELDLTPGAVNNFTVKVKLNEDETNVASYVKNLLFTAGKNVVVEEFTGTTCPNCPRGIVALENLEKYYPGRIIPVALHTYSGDRLNSGMDAYAAYLGMNAAPSGRVNRGEISDPMAVYDNEYRLSGAGLIDESGFEVKTWFDLASEEINTPADAKVQFKASYDEATGMITIPGNVTFTLGYANRNVNLFTVILEHDVEDIQLNNHYSLNMEVLGDWGNGGKYGQNMVSPYSHKHVARGVLSTLYSGTPGLIPSAIQAGTPYEFNIEARMPQTVDNPANTSIVVMALDNDSHAFINAGEAKMNDPKGSESGVGNVSVAEADVKVFADNGTVYALGAGEMALAVYAPDGTQIAYAGGVDTVAVELNRTSGIVIVKVNTAKGSKSVKLTL